MLTGKPAAILAGGACAFQLPRDPSCAAQARSLLAATMRELDFALDPIEDAKLAVSELATNAHIHAPTATRPELWIWARTRPTPELVVSVFDAHRDAWPVIRDVAVLDEHSKGLSIVTALSTETGTHFTRSRLTRSTGKCVWFTLALPSPWPTTDRVISPAIAANRLSEVLRARGIPAACRSDDHGISILNTGALKIRVEPKAFSWRDGDNHTRRPLIDLQDTAERIVSHHETAHLISGLT